MNQLKNSIYSLSLSVILLSSCGKSEPEIIGLPGSPQNDSQKTQAKAEPNSYQRKAEAIQSKLVQSISKDTSSDSTAPTIQSRMLKYAKKGTLPTIEITNEDLNDPLLTPKTNQKTTKQSTKTNSSSDEEVIRADFARRTYLRDPHKKKPKDNYRARYGVTRLDKAAVIKRYAPVTIMPVQLDAHCSTAWDRGLLHVRVAYLGPQHNLNVFMNENHMLYISFQDEAGSPVYRFEIPISQMKKAPPTMNDGTPTFQVEGQLPLELETYERFFQWTIEWN